MHLNLLQFGILKDDSFSLEKHLYFRRFVAFYLFFAEAFYNYHYTSRLHGFSLCFLLLGLLLSFTSRWKIGLSLQLICFVFDKVAAKDLLTIPDYWANHLCLEFLCILVLLYWDDENKEEVELANASLRYAFSYTMFFSGVQKFLYGTYFKGEMLNYLILEYKSYKNLLGFLLSSEEMNHLMTLKAQKDSFTLSDISQFEPVIGDLSSQNPLIIILSNSVWIFEILGGLLIFHAKLRHLGILISLLVLFAVESGAREVYFGLFMINLVFLFVKRNWSQAIFYFSILALVFFELCRQEVIGIFVYPR